MSSKLVDKLMYQVVLKLCESIDSPRSLAVWLCFKHDHNALLQLKSDPRRYQSASDFRLDYLISSYLSKYKGLRTGIDTRAEALRSWTAAEIQCKITNERLRKQRLQPSTGCVEDIILIARRKIASVLGPFSVARMMDWCQWGSGATFDLRRGCGLDKKMSVVPISVTASALPYFRTVVEHDPNWIEALTGFYPEGPVRLLPGLFKIVEGNKFDVVPKNAKTGRCISIEPTGNGFLQQGVGQYIRRRLRRFGIDLNDQSVNQELARVALDQDLATLDLSMASDTVSKELVFDLLPVDWANYLDSIRSRKTRIGKKKWVTLEKFSPMGNAFTFELETLIFWSLITAVQVIRGQSGTISVYGDDIICPSAIAHEVVDVFNYFGFTVNEEKSFIDGPFRESCGKHYFHGEDVTPIYQKEIPGNVPELIRAANRFIRYSLRHFRTWRHRLIVKPWKALYHAYQGEMRPAIPFYDEGDDGYLVHPRELDLDRNHGYKCHVLAEERAQRRGRDSAILAWKLRRFVSLNADPRGYVSFDTGCSTLTYKTRYVMQHLEFGTSLSAL